MHELIGKVKVSGCEVGGIIRWVAMLAVANVALDDLLEEFIL